MTVTPNEIIAIAIGLLIGIALQRPLTCQRACCVPLRGPARRAPGPIDVRRSA